MKGHHTAYISIGSNMGDRLANCCRGIALLCADGRVRVAARSPFYETEPVNYTNQDWFLNAGLKIHTDMAPLELLHRLQEVQRDIGRKSGGVRFGPRILDLDIIFYDDLVMQAADLTLPHKRMHKRRFVLQPICDIDPGIVHPVLGQSVQRLLDRLEDEGQGIRLCSYDC